MLHIAPEMITADQVIKLGFIESWGRGICKIQQGPRNAKLKSPVFEANMGGMLVTIFREKTVPETAQKTAQKITHILSTKQQEIHNYLSTHPSASRNEIIENIPGISEDGVNYNLKGRQQKGIIKRWTLGSEWGVAERLIL